MEKWEVGSEKEWKDFEEKWQKEHDEVVGLGGLHVIGTERHESRRIDNQLRGRSGRQGDPGSSRFFVALDDDLMRIFGGDQVSKMMTLFKLPEDQPLEHGMVSKAIEQSQVKVEGFNFDQRKHLVEYDDIANKQREVIYRLRRKVLEGQNWKEEILTIIKGEIDNLIRMYFPEGISEPEKEKIIHGFCEIVPFDDQSQLRLADQIGQVKDPEKISEFLLKIVTDLYDSREKQLGPELSREIEKFAYLSSIDKLWMDHLDAMDDLRDGVGLRGNNDQERIAIYKKDAFEMFETLVRQIDYEVVRKIFRIQVGAAPPPMPMPQNISTNLDSSDSTGLKQKPVVVEKKLGRNDPCWCGSGKKFKHCHYPQLG